MKLFASCARSIPSAWMAAPAILRCSRALATSGRTLGSYSSESHREHAPVVPVRLVLHQADDVLKPLFVGDS
jgi:hypothetical protein